MRTILFFSFMFLFQAQVNAQTNTDGLKELREGEQTTEAPNDSLMVYNYCEIMPSMQTKEYKSFDEYVSKHLIYPDEAKALGISGTVIVEFIIETNGSVSNVKIVKGRGLHPSCDREVIRVVSDSPEWKPGMQNGKPVRTKIYKKFLFNLTDSK